LLAGAKALIVEQGLAARLKPGPDTKPRHDAFHKRTHPSATNALEWGTNRFFTAASKVVP
jgi:hypothetical protein